MEFNKPNPYVLSLEIGGTKLQWAAASSQGDILAKVRGRVAPEAGAPGILAWIEATYSQLLAQARRWGEPAALGCGFGGPVDSAAGRILKSNQISGWDGFALKEWLEALTHLPVVVANDSNAAAWGEYRLGSGRGTRQFFYTNIGSGIGGGLVIDGKLYDGQGYGAGEFGHTYAPDWTVGHPGAAAKIEDLCSGWAIERRLRTTALPSGSLLLELCGGDQGTLSAAMLAEAARQGDEWAQAEIERVAETIATGLANVLSLFSPEVIAIGGGVSNMGEVLLEPIRRHTRRLAFITNLERYRITPSKLGEAIVLVGAAILAGENESI